MNDNGSHNFFEIKDGFRNEFSNSNENAEKSRRILSILKLLKGDGNFNGFIHSNSFKNNLEREQSYTAQRGCGPNVKGSVHLDQARFTKSNKKQPTVIQKTSGQKRSNFKLCQNQKDQRFNELNRDNKISNVHLNKGKDSKTQSKTIKL